ncbi:histidine phosphatase superfamily [Dunaliella salina]|uniref:Histidine phosphatase superfamily n=1 Tax=Dunaliella salina TaxID=3046 RepID=A0ABQ7FU39_DUNSA|nr:histidine phosphatase superfamily [Dunaliella salina]|eukprot:KAF5825880.1 histidine phosphatase superfamily [Dunaliella salina]
MLSISSGQQLSVLPLNYTKTIHFVRHGEAMSNVHGEKDRAQYKSPEWFDADLSEKGWAQAEALGKHIVNRGIKPQLVVTSPMTRALQTASGTQKCLRQEAQNL